MAILLTTVVCCNLSIGFAVGRYVQRQRQAALDAWTAPRLHPPAQDSQQPETTSVGSEKQPASDDLAGFIS